jgi:hypothetical protein
MRMGIIRSEFVKNRERQAQLYHDRSTIPFEAKVGEVMLAIAEHVMTDRRPYHATIHGPNRCRQVDLSSCSGSGWMEGGPRLLLCVRDRGHEGLSGDWICSSIYSPRRNARPGHVRPARSPYGPPPTQRNACPTIPTVGSAGLGRSKTTTTCSPPSST